ncbi:MAG: hypothetical protein WDZ84_11290 [Rhodovibrionaceae bacterium]
MPKLLSLPALLLGLTAAAPALADYPFTYDEGRRCRPAVADYLADLRIAPESIEAITFKEKTSPSLSFPRLIGFDAWVRPRDIKGYLVLVMGLGCGLQRAYTTGDYEVEGVD